MSKFFEHVSFKIKNMSLCVRRKLLFSLAPLKLGLIDIQLSNSPIITYSIIFLKHI